MSETSLSSDIQRNILVSLESGLRIAYDPEAANMVNFRKAVSEPVQRWFPYREGYSEKVVSRIIKEFGITGAVYDPFCGSGTTLLAARRRGLPSAGIDINPLSALMSSIKNEPYAASMPESIDELNRIIDSLALPEPDYSTPFPLAAKVFNPAILTALLQLKELIESIKPYGLQRLAFGAWLSILEQVSDVKKEGNGIKYRYRRRSGTGYIVTEREKWEREYFPADKVGFVRNALKNKLSVMAEDIKCAYGPCLPAPSVTCGDCLNAEERPPEGTELVFFSPPYCNCFDYFEIHKIEMWMGRFVSSAEDFRRYKCSGFCSNTNTAGMKEISYRHEGVEKLIGILGDELWNRKLPAVIRGYFDDMHTLLKKLHGHIVRGGRIGIVVGSSAYSGVIIPTDVLIANIAMEIGFKVDSVRITRHLTTSSQQIRRLAPLKDHLRESIILLRK